MTPFFDLFVRSSRRGEPWKDPAWADRQFPLLIAQSPQQPWRPGDPFPGRGVRILLGVATWSGYDMRLLDVIAEALRSGMPGAPVVQVFNTANCQTENDFGQYIPGASRIFQTPVVGIWQDGRLQQQAQGAEARDLVAKQFGSSSSEIVRYVSSWIEAQSLAQGS